MWYHMTGYCDHDTSLAQGFVFRSASPSVYGPQGSYHYAYTKPLRLIAHVPWILGSQAASDQVRGNDSKAWSNGKSWWSNQVYVWDFIPSIRGGVFRIDIIGTGYDTTCDQLDRVHGPVTEPISRTSKVCRVLSRKEICTELGIICIS